MKLIPILILSIFLTSCGLFKKDEIPVIAEAKVVRINPEILSLCPLLKENITLVSFEDTLAAYGAVVNMYSDCAQKQFNSSTLLKQFGGIKDGQN